MHTAAHEIVTVSADLMCPCCIQTDDASAVSCSASHDDRFAVAVASDSAVGVDVEKISTRLLKSQRLYMSEKEQALVQESPLGEIEAAVRIWSIKEAVHRPLG
jgi:phosphopantetheinyl transferase